MDTVVARAVKRNAADEARAMVKPFGTDHALAGWAQRLIEARDRFYDRSRMADVATQTRP